MANIYINDEVLEELDKQRQTELGSIDRSEFINALLNKNKGK